MSKENALFKENAISINFFYIIGLAFIVFGFTQQPLGELWDGLVTINTSVSSLVTDYFQVGGIGAAFVNAGLLLIFDATVIRDDGWVKAGPLFAALLTCLGLGFMGKTIVATIPLSLGVFLHSRYNNKEFISMGTDALFITTLAPFVNLVAFGLGMNPVLGIIVAYVAGILLGFFLPYLSAKFAAYHEGFSLYGYGFIAGVGGLLVISIMSGWGVPVDQESVIYPESGTVSTIFVIAVLVIFIILGAFLANKPAGSYRTYLKEVTGKGNKTLLNDYGVGVNLINAGVVGLVAIAYLMLIGAPINGAALSGIFVMSGFGAFGKTPVNIIPVMFGVWLFQALAPETNPADTGVFLAALYGTTLAPMSGEFGPIVGVLSGMTHAAVVGNLTPLHAGVNLYNNGFSGAFVATVYSTILRNFVTPTTEKRALESK